MMRFRISWLPLLCALLLVAGCDMPQSTFAGAGEEARRTALLFWVMLSGGAAIVLLITVLIFAALFGSEKIRRPLSRENVVLVGGLVFPITVLSALLVYGLLVLGAGQKYADADNPLKISVIGEQWWWRIIYKNPDGSSFETANELRLPVDRVVEIELTSADVIHSFWIPSYAGKLDMVPGRTNTLRFVVTEPGFVRGQCAEYCGGAHAWMAFYAAAMPAEEFEAWRLREQMPAASPSSGAGESLFLASGCGGCHAIRGTAAQGVIGPDLTHVGSRQTLGAGVLPNNQPAFARWIAHHQDVKPGTHMPPFEFFSDEDVLLLARYLDGLT